MNRRDIVFNTAAMAVSASLGAIACGARDAVAQRGGATSPENAHAMADLADDCVKKGLVCLDHCDRLLASGDASMTECKAAVTDMLAVAEMLGKLAKAGSPHLAGAARLAIETCGACEAACRPHAGRHPTCGDCAEACAKAVALCKSIAA